MSKTAFCFHALFFFICGASWGLFSQKHGWLWFENTVWLTFPFVLLGHLWLNFRANLNKENDHD